MALLSAAHGNHRHARTRTRRGRLENFTREADGVFTGDCPSIRMRSRGFKIQIVFPPRRVIYVSF